jgi:hypothetical protein
MKLSDADSTVSSFVFFFNVLFSSMELPWKNGREKKANDEACELRVVSLATLPQEQDDLKHTSKRGLQQQKTGKASE